MFYFKCFFFSVVTNSTLVTLKGTDDVRLIASPDWPDFYPNNVDVTVIVVSPDGSSVRVNVMDFEIEAQCAYDSLTIYDGKYRFHSENCPMCCSSCENCLRYSCTMTDSRVWQLRQLCFASFLTLYTS